MSVLKKIRSSRRRTKLGVIVAFVFAIWMLWPDNVNREALHPPRKTIASSQPCIELRPKFGPYQEALVDRPGLYCVVTDFWQQRLYGAGHSGPGFWRQLIDVSASDVTIELRNHILHSDGHSSGIFVSSDDKKNLAESSRMQYRLNANNITIKNGVIDIRGLGRAVASFNKWRMYTINEGIPVDFLGYTKSNIVLENLLIKADDVGIVLEGDGNIIRNCVIESGGNGAIMMAGPNGRIENNTIILRNPFIPASMAGVSQIQPRHVSEFLERKKAPHAAIALHQASGTVISGNRIEVKGKSATRHNIYLLHDSQNVRIEGNTFVGDGAPVTLVDGSSAELKNNVFEKKKANWWPF